MSNFATAFEKYSVETTPLFLACYDKFNDIFDYDAEESEKMFMQFWTGIEFWKAHSHTDFYLNLDGFAFVISGNGEHSPVLIIDGDPALKYDMSYFDADTDTAIIAAMLLIQFPYKVECFMEAYGDEVDEDCCCEDCDE